MKRSSMSALEYREMVNGNKAAGRQKYHAKPVKYNGEKFDSTKEWERFMILKDMEAKGEINDLKRQVRYSLDINNYHICDYIADAQYFLPDNILVVEDTKGMRREKYRDKTGKMKYRSSPAYEMFLLKKKMMKAIHGIEILET